ncbi:ethylbenzene dehydrogenase-related protein [Zooshikella ganghwensis]|uniref:Cytochrome c-552/DMSO reductase-like haem-binding domain-containing protein n=1 Tax=Zooshikella ganghwensis TaxID=202772 RepID=A0A4P9VJD5_9GAMM|nr:ethylbenzene dehydrogenase-related protein [Zooshikella ganghwensis]RDH43375.1 hypothetical protein B9G39_07945 [Zooshikella ganghwensis]
MEMFSYFKWSLLLFSLHISAVSFSQTIHVVQANGKPVINGVGDEWGNIPSYSIPLKQSDPQGKTNVAEVIIKAATFEDSVYIYSEWKDSTLSLTHKPFIWSDKKGRYETGPQREDRITIQFAMSGKYNTNWLSGDEFVADMWHWKAFRSNPLGLAHDKMTIISKSKMSGSLKVNTAGGLFISSVSLIKVMTFIQPRDMVQKSITLCLNINLRSLLKAHQQILRQKGYGRMAFGVLKCLGC